MWIVKHRSVFFIISALLIIGSVAVILSQGLNWGIDFTGGTILEVEYAGARPGVEDIRTAAAKANLGPVAVQPTGELGVTLRLKTITDEERTALIKVLPTSPDNQLPTEKRFNAIGPSVGEELAQKGLIAIALVVILIVLYLTLVFWSVSRPVASWKYGVVAVIKLVHDLAITTGIFVALGAYLGGGEINALFLAAFLTVLGLSVNDVIAVFDRIRENLRRRVYSQFEETVGHSLVETMTRSLNTSLTVIFVLLCIYFFGGSTTRDFALVLSIGMIVATYSSVFIASPLLVTWNNFSSRKLKKKA